jgi:hypothetical protein
MNQHRTLAGLRPLKQGRPHGADGATGAPFALPA